ncbi:flagellin N-terminal helical domain-containing protein [Massilia niastensis]|uniref:flagellin N-terminal helical domain-containing protein n=1 Tax=Massilia niastensis TaxID=544911 RepID=UPI000360B2F2|nr:flagellin [Massilia niastensis]
MLSLHTNNAALSAQNAITRTQNSLSTSMTRLSTGYRINSAMDDAAGLQIASRLKAQTSGMGVAMRNTQNSTSMLQTAEGALDEVSNMMIRMKDLATQAADASSTAADKTAMNAEYAELAKELNNVMTNTTFGGTSLFGTTMAAPMDFQIGAGATEVMTVDFSGGVTAVTGSVTAITAGSLATAAGATAAITLLETGLQNSNTLRSSLGASANRLEHVYNNLANISTNTKNATGRIMDVDFATESANMTSSQMLLQAGTAMLKQSNSMSSMVMSLLQ